MVIVAKRKKGESAFGRRLRALREAKGLTQAALGAAAGDMQPSAIARLESGAREPNWSTVLILAEALGVTPDEFLEQDGDDEPPVEGPVKKPGK